VENTSIRFEKRKDMEFSTGKPLFLKKRKRVSRLVSFGLEGKL